MITEVLLLVGAYIVGYALLYLVARLAANQYKKTERKGMLIISMLLHMTFILVSIPAAMAYNTLFSALEATTGEIFYIVAVGLCVIAALIHAWGLYKCVRYLYDCVKSD
jgi:putative effector of murein hydrolase LrgA (UPF0299 family)